MEEKEKKETVENEKPAVVETKKEELPSVPEKEKEEPKQPEKQEKGKKNQTIFLILLFVVFLAFIYFLPEITSFIKKQQNQQEITETNKSGTMQCHFTREGESIDYDIEQSFTYEENKLKKSTITTTNQMKSNSTNSDIVNAQASCEVLKQSLASINGISIDCQGNETEQTTVETIDYTVLNLEDLTANIAELGGFAPEYELDQNINTIEKSLEQNGYSCSRIEY